SGQIADGFVWGRGSLDDKDNLMAQVEAVEMLLKSGFRPRRTIVLAYGHDEEVSGSGAGAIVKTLAARGVLPEFVLDEGFIVQGLIPGVAAPVATVAVAEKGYASVELKVTAPGG